VRVGVKRRLVIVGGAVMLNLDDGRKGAVKKIKTFDLKFALVLTFFMSA